MKYEYRCTKCATNILVEKSMDQSARQESCPTCQLDLMRIFSKPQLMSIRTSDSYYSHALGKVVSGPKEERRLAKAANLIEVGNEDVKKHTRQPDTSFPTVDQLHKMGAFN